MFIWLHDDNYKKIAFPSPLGRLVKDSSGIYHWDNSGFIETPNDYRDYKNSYRSEIFVIKNISGNSYYLRFTNYTHYALLYHFPNIKPVSYLNLGEFPFPSTNDISRDGSIATSIKTHTLVTGQAVFDGINVYQFDPKTKILYRVWAPIVHHPFNTPKEYSKDVPTLPGISFKQLSEIHRVE